MEKSNTQKYVELWEQVLPHILDFLANGEKSIKLQLTKESFNSVGNRVNSGYTFRLDIEDGVVPTKKGSAVARDLKRVLDNSKKFKEYAINKDITIRLDSKFIMHILVY